MKLFERMALVVIVTNTIVLVAGFVDDRHEHVLLAVETVFLWFFVAELGVRFRAAGWDARRFCASKWNVFDTVIIVAAFLPVLGVGITLLRMARLARVVHSVRHVSGLRLFDVLRRRKHAFP